MKVLLLILTITISVSSQSVKEGKGITDWTALANGQNARVYFAPKTIQRNEDSIKVWIKIGFPQGDEGLFIPGESFGELRAYAVFNCKNNSVKATTLMLYDLNGTVQHKKEKASNEIAHESPATFGYALFEHFCERPSMLVGPPTLKP